MAFRTGNREKENTKTNANYIRGLLKHEPNVVLQYYKKQQLHIINKHDLIENKKSINSHYGLQYIFFKSKSV